MLGRPPGPAMHVDGKCQQYTTCKENLRQSFYICLLLHGPTASSTLSNGTLQNRQLPWQIAGTVGDRQAVALCDLGASQNRPLKMLCLLRFEKGAVKWGGSILRNTPR